MLQAVLVVLGPPLPPSTSHSGCATARSEGPSRSGSITGALLKAAAADVAGDTSAALLGLGGAGGLFPSPTPLEGARISPSEILLSGRPSSLSSSHRSNSSSHANLHPRAAGADLDVNDLVSLPINTGSSSSGGGYGSGGGQLHNHHQPTVGAGSGTGGPLNSQSFSSLATLRITPSTVHTLAADDLAPSPLYAAPTHTIRKQLNFGDTT